MYSILYFYPPSMLKLFLISIHGMPSIHASHASHLQQMDGWKQKHNTNRPVLSFQNQQQPLSSSSSSYQNNFNTLWYFGVPVSEINFEKIPVFCFKYKKKVKNEKMISHVREFIFRCPWCTIYFQQRVLFWIFFPAIYILLNFFLNFRLNLTKNNGFFYLRAKFSLFF